MENKNSEKKLNKAIAIFFVTATILEVVGIAALFRASQVIGRGSYSWTPPYTEFELTFVALKWMGIGEVVVGVLFDILSFVLGVLKPVITHR